MEGIDMKLFFLFFHTVYMGILFATSSEEEKMCLLEHLRCHLLHILAKTRQGRRFQPDDKD